MFSFLGFIAQFSAILFVIFQIPLRICCTDYNDTETLYQSIFSGYNKEIRPGFNQSQPLEVTVKFYLEMVTDLNEIERKLTTVGFFELVWNDHRISWDPAVYGNKDTLVVPEEKVWLPPLYLVNSHKNLLPMRTGELFYLSYLSNGSSYWNAGGKFESICNVDPSNYPFDEQKCNLIYFPDGYTKEDIKLQLVSPVVDNSFYKSSGVWNIQNITGEEVGFGNSTGIRYQVRLIRKPTFFIVTLLIPIISMGILNLFVFVLPAASGERVGYCVTLLLAFGVYLSIFATSLPTPNVAMICYFLLSQLILSSMITFCTIIGLLFYNKEVTKPVPPFVRKIVICLRSIRSCRTYKIHHARNDKQEKAHSSPGTNAIDAVENVKVQHLLDEKENAEPSNVTWTDFANILDWIFICIFFLWTLVGILTYIGNIP